MLRSGYRPAFSIGSGCHLSTTTRKTISTPIVWRAASLCKSRQRGFPEQHQSRTFSACALLRAEYHDKRNLYEVLGVSTAASKSDIKKKFYALSLAHHPDKNRDNPAASKEYSHISAAYNTLSDDGARAKYDRDHAIGPSAAQRAAANGRRKTHVGARPASGLSKRRSPFTGPPPSFYSSGGYGGTGRRTPRPPYSGRKPGETRPTEPDPAEFVKRNEVPHFDAESHLRTQQNQDERRRQRRAENLASGAKRRGDVADNDVGGSEPRRFVLLSGVIIFAAVVTAWMGTTANEKRNENRKKQQQQQRRKEKEEQGEEVGKSET